MATPEAINPIDTDSVGLFKRIGQLVHNIVGDGTNWYALDEFGDGEVEREPLLGAEIAAFEAERQARVR